MSKPSKEKGKASKARLLALAASEFARKGYHEVKVSDIVSAAGLTQPAFYLYFSSKEEIFNELTDAFRKRMRTLIENSLLNSGIEREHIYEHIKAGLKALFEYLATEPDLTRIGLFIDPKNAQIKAEMVQAIRGNLVEEQQAGYFRKDLDMEFVAECLWSMIEWHTDKQLLPGICDAEKLAGQIVDLLLHGMMN